MKQKSVFISSVLFIALLITLWWIYLPSDRVNNTTTNTHTFTSMDTPDSYMDGITFYEFNNKGQLHQKITSTHAIHFEKNNRLAYQKPHIVVYSTSGGNWQITSESGQSHDGTDVITLTDHVVVHRNKSDHNPETTAKTSMLTALPKTNTLKTSKPISIHQPHLLITGTGLIGNLQTGELKTLANTKTIYTPKA